MCELLKPNLTGINASDAKTTMLGTHTELFTPTNVLRSWLYFTGLRKEGYPDFDVGLTLPRHHDTCI